MSIKRKLNALGYPNLKVNLDDERQVKEIFKWLEEKKTQCLSKNDRDILCDVNSNKWNQIFEIYLEQLNCPIKYEKKLEALDWCLGVAVREGYKANQEIYNKYCVDVLKSTNVPSVVADNTLDHLDYSSKEFKEGIDQIAQILKVPPHTDPLVTLEACSKIVQQRLTTQAINNPQEFIISGTAFPYQDTDVGFALPDPKLSEATKLLRLLYIHDLRDLQTKINESIVAVQEYTHNPKTDPKIGLVGR